MNGKLLYAATLVISLISSLAMADVASGASPSTPARAAAEVASRRNETGAASQSTRRDVVLATAASPGRRASTALSGSPA